MAGWINSTDPGVGTGRGAGGRGFANRRYTSDTIQGGSSSGGGSRWRGERSRGRPPPQPYYRYRPVDAAHRHSSPSTGSEQQRATTSTRHTQMNHPAAATVKSPASGIVAPADSNNEPDDKGSRNAANFECNVCFEMAAEPVVTKCGHLFCWECLYQWLHVHSDARECPVCKGEVAEDAVIPIYGRGGSAASLKNAPPRPTGARVESSRQQQQQHQPHTWPYQVVYVEEEDDEEDNPFDFPNMGNFGFGDTSLRYAMRSFHDVDMAEEYDGHSYEISPEYFDEVDFNFMGFPAFASADNPGSSQMLADLVDLTDSIAPPVHHHRDFGYSGQRSHNRGRRGRCHRARASAHQSSTDAIGIGGSSGFYRDNGANSNGSVGSSSRPNSDWAERRERSNRNSNSASRRGMRDGRRQWTNYS